MGAVDPVPGHLLHGHLPVLPRDCAALLIAPHLMLCQYFLALIRALLVFLLHTLGRTFVHPSLALDTMPGTKESLKEKERIHLRLSH